MAKNSNNDEERLFYKNLPHQHHRSFYDFCFGGFYREVNYFIYIDAIGLRCAFESAVYILDDKGRPRVWTPDFYIPDLGIYIEVVGDNENPNYSWRKAIYTKNHVPIIFIASYQSQDWQAEIVAEINNIDNTCWERIKKLQAKWV